MPVTSSLLLRRLLRSQLALGSLLFQRHATLENDLKL
jgi:hypothetical protein